MQEYRYYIGGEFKESKEFLEVFNPATQEKFARVYQASLNDVELARGQAKEAQKVWQSKNFKERAKLLRQIASCIFDNLHTLADLETREIGKAFKETLFVDIALGADCFNYYASLLEGLEETAIQSETGLDLETVCPFGVVGVYLPYNVPIMIFGFTCAAALAAGNAVIIKPSEYGMLSILELVKYLNDLDLPKGLISVVPGKGEIIGKFLAESAIDLISFTGSKETLEKIIGFSARFPKKIICELGGCNIAAVFSDAVKEDAIQNILGAAFMKQGQMCIGTSLVLIQESEYDVVIEDLLERVKQIRLGNPLEPDTGMGPLPSAYHLKKVEEQVTRLVNNGAKVLYGGKKLDGQGYFYPPTVIALDEVYYEEFFAPVVCVKSFKDGCELEKIIEENPTGLVLQIWTENIEVATTLANRARCGTVWINTFAQMSSQTTFGGMGTSGWGRNLGKAGFYEYVQQKHIGIGFKKSPVQGWFGV